MRHVTSAGMRGNVGRVGCIVGALFAFAVFILPLAQVSAYETLWVPTEVRYIDGSAVYDGYTMFASRGTTYLIDLNGRVVHTWKIGTNPKLLANGGILDATKTDPSGHSGFQEVDWSSATVWNYTETRTGYTPHHDYERIYNTKLGQYTTIYIANKDITNAEAIAAGCDPANAPYDGAQMDTIVEVAMNGTVVWEWRFFDHGIQDVDATKANYVGAGKTISDYPGRLDFNLPNNPVRKDWLHCNALDYNQDLDQIVINSVQGEFYVVDHGNTFVPNDPAASIALAAGSAGDFLYRFGDPARYGKGSFPSVGADWTTSTTGTKQMGGTHDIQWIPDGVPGAGNFLVFNNGQYLLERAPQSYALEINGYYDSSSQDTGHYVDPPSAGYHALVPADPQNTSKQARLVSNQTVWMYGSKSCQELFSHIGSSAQRLPNGNTLICADTNGKIFEVTSGGKIVWEYVDPVASTGVTKVMADSWPMTSSMFRAYRYPPTFSAFSGRDMTPGNPITGPASGTDFRPVGGATETFYLDNSTTYGGYTLFAANGTTYLIDMEGKLVHTWDIGMSPRLLENGTLLDAVASSSNALDEVRLLDWNGNTLWSYKESRSGYVMHHDFILVHDTKLDDNAIMYLASKPVTNTEAIDAGCDPANAPYVGAMTDGIVEASLDGTIIWEWWFFNHGIQDVAPTKLNYVGSGKGISDYPGRIDLNLPGRPLSSNWLNCTSIDYNENLDQIVVNSELGEFYVVDHGNTFVPGNPSSSIALAAGSGGDFLYRFGDPARYGQGSPPSATGDGTSSTSGNKQIGGSNNVHWIAQGLPGAGHFLIFNNGQYLFDRTSQSWIFEVNPYLDSSGTDTGNYVNPPTAGYYKFDMPKDTHKPSKQISNQVVWMYYAKSNIGFFSSTGSSAQRLPNGNTLVCAMAQGHLFEVASNGTVAWEYINPVTTGGIKSIMYDNYPMTNPVYRALRYSAGYAGFSGKDLASGQTITGTPTHYMTPDDFGPSPAVPELGPAFIPALFTMLAILVAVATRRKKEGLA